MPWWIRGMAFTHSPSEVRRSRRLRSAWLVSCAMVFVTLLRERSSGYAAQTRLSFSQCGHRWLSGGTRKLPLRPDRVSRASATLPPPSPPDGDGEGEDSKQKQMPAFSMQQAMDAVAALGDTWRKVVFEIRKSFGSLLGVRLEGAALFFWVAVAGLIFLSWFLPQVDLRF